MDPAGRAWSKCRGFSPAQRLSSGAAALFGVRETKRQLADISANSRPEGVLS
jgi:hypothetical protein